MKVEYKTISKDKKTIQITLSDERWYLVDDKFIPSVTWIADSYPKGTEFYKWLASKGWDESQSIKEAAGDRGSRVHNAINALIDGHTINHDETIPGSDGNLAELTVDEYVAVKSYADWAAEQDFIVTAHDILCVDNDGRYAGTADIFGYFKDNPDEKWVIDLKTGSNIWPSYEIQVNMYWNSGAGIEAGINRRGILQVGYRRNKNKFKFTEIGDKIPLILAALEIWKNEHGTEEPSQLELPTSITLNKPGETIAAKAKKL